MPNIDPYWRKLASAGQNFLQNQGNMEAAAVIKHSIIEIELNSHIDWNGGIDYWDLVFRLKTQDYTFLEDDDKKNSVEEAILSALEQFHACTRNQIANVLILPAVEDYIDWQAVRPVTKESAIQLISKEREALTNVATETIPYKDDEVEEEYGERHRKILDIAKRAGFEYPITANTLAEWWEEVKYMAHPAERQQYISELFSPLINTLRDSAESDDNINFQQAAARSDIVLKAVEDAEVFIREGKYDSAVDRIHTAFHGYLRQLLIEHDIACGTGEGLPVLYSKLHGQYSRVIQPSEIGERVKSILRSGSGMINTINELRNNNTIVHPNGHLIQKREAKLVIRLVNAIMDYIEDIENDL